MTMFPEQTDFDEAARFLIREGGGPLLAWLLAEPPDGLRFQGWLDSVLTLPGTKERVCDAIARFETAAGEPIALLVEVQTRADASMFGRLCVAGGILWTTLKPNDLPGDRFGLMGLVINLTGTGNSGRSFRRATSVWELLPREWDLANRNAMSTFDEVEAGRAPLEALAFIPLMKNGGDGGIILRWLEAVGREPDRRRRDTLTAAAGVFAELAAYSDDWKKALEGFDVNESKIVSQWKTAARSEGLREGHREGERVGELKGVTAAVLRCLRARFGTVPDDLTQGISHSTDLAHLNTLLEAASTTSSLGEFRHRTGV